MLDRDGTLIVAHHYLSDPKLVELIPNAAAALRRLRNLGLGVIVATNQSPVGRNIFTSAILEKIHRRMNQLLAMEGAEVDGIYFCPHTPNDNCQCRKPKPGMIERAARDFGFLPEECFVVGDNVCDIELGKNVKATTILVRTGHGARIEQEGVVTPDFVVDDLGDAVDVISELIGSTDSVSASTELERCGNDN